MNGSMILACLWAVTATLIAILPSRDRHWRAAYLLIGAGIPILGWVTLQNGPWVGLIVLAAGASILRWPLIYLWRRIRRS
ncbi:MAG TPA: DUF2484 family protein [Albidovulum sp.]|uniref:DUF2484 family protein n=1 Tax=Albidovulum sp. TaxID=1872424 RepID=UPI002B779AF7|nr:DUF2484 family protein [Albidovulum sp.]